MRELFRVRPTPEDPPRWQVWMEYMGAEVQVGPAFYSVREASEELKRVATVFHLATIRGSARSLKKT